MFDSLLWVLYHFVIHYAGQNTQGNKDDGNGVDQVFGSKKVTSLLQRADSLRWTRELWKTKAPDQKGASAPADLQPEKRRKGGHWLRNLFKSCPQQQSLPEPRPSTSHESPQSDKMPLPVYIGESEAESYRQSQNAEQYRAFTKRESKYFKSEYSSKKKLGQGSSGMVYRATRKSNGMKVAYKSIPKSDEYKYAAESTPHPICHPRNPIIGFEEQSAAQCISSRPPNLMVPHEFMIQMYLSRPGYENPYVPVVFDYYILKNKYMMVMEYFDKKWVTLLSYLKKKKRLGIVDARDIVREVVKAMISLKQHGILHKDLHDENIMYSLETGRIKLIDFGMSAILPGWEEGKSFPLKSSNSSPTVSKYKAKRDELESEADLDQRWLDGIVKHESMGTRHDNQEVGQHG
ncbi:hypothetical protein BASA61_003114 [Batrachochytrium salamandrivorans]|nr:hypothetical protein BASA61_003114 [Batrachochytrium salamandrivorans]